VNFTIESGTQGLLTDTFQLNLLTLEKLARVFIDDHECKGVRDFLDDYFELFGRK